MTTITEDYVSFEVAKLLKEKGFDEKVSTHYLVHPSGFPEFFDKKDEFTEPGDVWLKCPTHQMAMKWLKEVHNIYYEIKLLLGEKAEKHGGLQLGIYQLNSLGAYVWKDWIYADTYVELYENYIKYCLENLI